MNDWLHEYEKQMRDWRNLEYQKKLDDRLERVRRVLDSGHPEYKKRHNELEKEAASRELLNVFRCRIMFLRIQAGVCIALAVMILLSGHHPIFAALLIGGCLWNIFYIYKFRKQQKTPGNKALPLLLGESEAEFRFARRS